MSLKVIGGGLAGCEAAWSIAKAGIPVELYEMKPAKFTPAHRSPLFAELVCSNSLKSEREGTAAGLLKAEMGRLGSICIESALHSRVPAGGALAVDRDKFSAYITEKIRSHPLIKVIEGEVTSIPEGICVIATGPLTSDALSQEISKLLGSEYLSFYDAVAPIIAADSIDMTKAFFASRYNKGGEDDYINCPMDKEQYLRFYDALVNAKTAPLHDFEINPKVYEGCMPVEVMAKRGVDTLRFGPLKPVGLTDPRTGQRPYAVVQLRRENKEGTMYNLVGFQTNLLFGEQKRVFSLIPGLENAEFLRYGVMHRNTFIDSPRLLTPALNLRKTPSVFFAGQITGVEGYMESAASGIMAGINSARLYKGKEPLLLPEETMLGALINYISNEEVKDFQPMGANFGLLSTIGIKYKQERYLALYNRALQSLENSLRSVENEDNS